VHRRVAALGQPRGEVDGLVAERSVLRGEQDGADLELGGVGRLVPVPAESRQSVG
jgi:hypothetical protein